MTNYCETPIEQLVPHSDPMILIDKVVEYGDDWLIAQVDIKQGAPFFDEQTMSIPTWVGIEYMAQTIAALAGIRALSNNTSVNLGFLLGSRKYQALKGQFLHQQSYQIKVKQLYMDDSGLASFDCSIFQGEEVFASAKLNVFETDDKNSIIK